MRSESANDTVDQILAAVEEMDAAIDDPARATSDMTRFLEIGREYQAFLESGGHPRDPRTLTAPHTQFGYALPWTTLSVANHSSNPDFLE